MEVVLYVNRHILQASNQHFSFLCLLLFLCYLLPMVFKYISVHLADMLVMAGNGYGLVGLDKDIESNGGYSDIQVMWEMLKSSHLSNIHATQRGKTASWRFCFVPS